MAPKASDSGYTMPMGAIEMSEILTFLAGSREGSRKEGSAPQERFH
jgi:hypothetical protein